LRPRPPEPDRARWRQRLGSVSGCARGRRRTDRIESFQRHVRDQAKAILGADLAAREVHASVRDGIDIRETLRNWHTATCT
jgi:hypothetical protein